MNKNFKKLFIVSLSTLNLLALTPNAFCAPITNPFSTSSTLNYIKESLARYNFSDVNDFKNYISLNMDYIDLTSSKINIEPNGVITVLLVYYNDFEEEVYFSIPELSLSRRSGIFRISIGIKAFNLNVARVLHKPLIKESDLYGCLIVPERTDSITEKSFENVRNMNLIYIPKHVSLNPYSLCHCPKSTKIVIQ